MTKQVARKYYEGAVFGKLTVVGRAPPRKNNKYVCVECSCGNPEIFQVFIGNLGRNHTTSCGCTWRENVTKHGLHNTREYRVRVYMIQRCYNTKHESYPDYGGRGITVCDRWLDSVENFYEDMGPCPEGLTLERIDVNGNYCPENCKWETSGNQGYNKRIRSNNTSGRTGVYWKESEGLWSAQIGFEGRVIPLGSSNSFEGAVKIREEGELKYYGWIKE